MLCLKNEGILASIQQGGFQVAEVYAYRFLLAEGGEFHYFLALGGEELQAGEILSLRDDDEVLLFMEYLHLWESKGEVPEELAGEGDGGVSAIRSMYFHADVLSTRGRDFVQVYHF